MQERRKSIVDETTERWSDQFSRLPPKLRWKLFRQFDLEALPAASDHASSPWQWQTTAETGTIESKAIKLLLENQRGVRCEAVALFPSVTQDTGSAPDREGDTKRTAQSKLPRATACISSQPGCGVGCPFCTTGELGYRGNLSAEEIAEQVFWLGCVARKHRRRMRNVVFMGMGEPLHNFDQVSRAIDYLTSSEFFGIPERRITLSTAGVPAAMVAIAQRFPKLRLALSLHAANSQLRKELVPRALADLDKLRQAVHDVNLIQTDLPVWIECVLFDQLNDARDHAQELARFCEGLHVEVNLIPYNVAGNPQQFHPSPVERREAFAEVLRAAGIRTTIRQSFGNEEAAACGQLRATSKS